MKTVSRLFLTLLVASISTSVFAQQYTTMPVQSSVGRSVVAAPAHVAHTALPQQVTTMPVHTAPVANYVAQGQMTTLPVHAAPAINYVAQKQMATIPVHATPMYQTAVGAPLVRHRALPHTHLSTTVPQIPAATYTHTGHSVMHDYYNAHGKHIHRHAKQHRKHMRERHREEKRQHDHRHRAQRNDLKKRHDQRMRNHEHNSAVRLDQAKQANKEERKVVDRANDQETADLVGMHQQERDALRAKHADEIRSTY